MTSSRPSFRPSTVPPSTGRARRREVVSALSLLRRDRGARVGIVVLGCVALVALFADVLASDLPIACRFHGATYLFPDMTHPAALSSYDNARLDAERSPGDWAIHPLVAFGPQQTATRGALAVMRSPSLGGDHPLGTDAFGRDVFARLVHGARTSLGSALLAAFAFVAIGTLLGALAGYFGGLLDAVVARSIEVLTAFPTLILVLVVQALVAHPSVTTMLAAIAFTRWPEVARLVRADVLLASSQDYVLAARALGAGPWRVLRRHVVPNVIAPILVAATFGLASVVLVEASLDFLHVGLPPATASWGETLSETREHVGAWWLLVFPGLAVFATVLSLNLVGEALRDALDPRLHAGVGGVTDPEPESSQRLGEGPPSSTAYDETPHV